MLEKIKKILRPIYVPIIDYKSSFLYKISYLFYNYLIDFKLYAIHSITFRKNNLKNKEADLILNYHSIEKGMLFKNMKKGFAEYRIRNLHKILTDPEIIQNVKKSQIRIGYQVVCKYYEIHQNLNYSIEYFYTSKQYDFYKKILAEQYQFSFEGVLNWNKNDFSDSTKKNFKEFAHSRKSVRDFTGEKIDLDLIRSVVELANTAPSVCNRQASNVYLIEDKEKIDKILKIQAGFTGYSKNVSQLLILTNDRKYYYTVGERYQFYIDGGLYLMNLLYALHYYGVGNCPANWGKTIKEEIAIRKVIDIPISEQIICLVPIGELKEQFRSTLSERRSISENFKILN